jgi:hypothetical protein
MRRRPSVPLAREAAAIDIRIVIRRIEVIDRPNTVENEKARAENSRRACRFLARCFTWRQ